MAHSSATGLVDNWRTRLASPYSTPSPQLTSFDPPISDYNSSMSSMSTAPMSSTSLAPMSSTLMIPMSTTGPLTVGQMIPVPTPNGLIVSQAIFPSDQSAEIWLQFEENPLPTFMLPKIVKGKRSYPGIKDLPAHLSGNFRNEFIRFVIKYVANLQSPWTNPDVETLQALYQVSYPVFPAQIRHSDAVFHPVSSSPPPTLRGTDMILKTKTALGVFRNHLAAAAISAVQEHVTNVFRQTRLKTVEARAAYINKLFESEDDHPIIW